MPFSNEWCLYYFTTFTEPWCHSPPDRVVNATYTYKPGYQHLTDTYQCIEGHTTNSSVSERTVKCSVTNNENCKVQYKKYDDTIHRLEPLSIFTCSVSGLKKSIGTNIVLRIKWFKRKKVLF